MLAKHELVSRPASSLPLWFLLPFLPEVAFEQHALSHQQMKPGHCCATTALLFSVSQVVGPGGTSEEIYASCWTRFTFCVISSATAMAIGRAVWRKIETGEEECLID